MAVPPYQDYDLVPQVNLAVSNGIVLFLAGFGVDRPASSSDAQTISSTHSVNPLLTRGNYPDTSMVLSSNTTVTPDLAPTNTTSITASTSTNFKGTFAADPITGVVRITDAHPADTYTVKVRTFNGTSLTSTQIFTLTVTTPPTCTPVIFAPPTTFPAGPDAGTSAVGDFNGDGNQDIVTANFTEHSVSILLGDGAGHFGPSTNFTAGTGVEKAEVADFNGDGKQDLAVDNLGSANISILLGDGTGQFGPPNNLDVGGIGYSMTVGDFNNDGKQDIAALSQFMVVIFLGDGTGNFSGGGSYSAGVEPYQIELGDFNNDGNPDLVVTNDLYPSTGKVSILLGDGTGHFSAPTQFSIGRGPNYVAVGDLNGDGKQDLAVSNPGANNISILLGNGVGGFGAAINHGAGDYPYSLAFGDFNGDGKQDLAVGNSDDVSILFGNGMGDFGSGTSVQGSVAVVGDFNNDGKQDIAGSGGDGVLILIRQCASPTPTATPTATATPTSTGTPAPPVLGNYPSRTIRLSADTTVIPDSVPANASSIQVFTSTNFKGLLEGDSMTGIVRVTNAHPAGAYTVTVRAFNADGQTSTKMFTLTVTQMALGCSVDLVGGGFGVDLEPESVAVGDFNGDGHQDIVTANALSGNVSILWGNGAANFAPATDINVGEHPLSVAVGDVNGDGEQDLVTANSEGNNVAILLGDGAGGFSAPQYFDTGDTPYSVAVGDFNGDGKKDLAVANADSNNVSILLGDGAGHFTSPTNFGAGVQPHSVAVGDFNSDNKQDLAVTNYGSNTVSILLGDGTGGFGAAANFNTGNGAHRLAVGDFNNDGKQDLAVSDLGAPSSNNVTILLGDGTGNFTPGGNTGVNFTPYGLTVGDLNGDGKLDLVVAGVNQNLNSSSVNILLGDGAGHFNLPSGISTGDGPRAVEVGDFNGDGRQDVAVTNIGVNTVSVYLTYCRATPSPPARPTATATATATATGTPRPTPTPSPTPTPTPVCDYVYTVTTGSIVPGTVDVGNHTDDGSTNIALPFSYTLYNRAFNQVAVGSNGQLTFGTVNNTFAIPCLPVSGATYVIAPYWTDQCTANDGSCSPTTGHGIFTSTTGVSPNRIFNIEWRTDYYGGGVALNYEVRLYEGQKVFDVIYGTVTPLGFGNDSELSVGVQDRGNTPHFTLVGCDPTGGQDPPVSTGQLYHFTYPTCPYPPPTPTPASTPTPTPGFFTILWEGFDTVTGPALPPGWVTSFTPGFSNCTTSWETCSLGSNWTTVAGASQTAPNSAFHNAPGCVTDSTLDTPSMFVPPNNYGVDIVFWHDYDLQDGFDGGVLEMSINGGPFIDFVAAGGSFVNSTGYNQTIPTGFRSPIAGRQAWTGHSGSFTKAQGHLPPTGQGYNMVLRFRLGTDCSVEGTGWSIDSLLVNYYVSDASPTPTPTVTPCQPVLTQSTSQAITTANSASCNDGVTHTDNSYWRAFNMAAYANGGQYCISSVSFGVEFANATQPVTVRLYTTSNFPAGFPGSLTQIATTTLNVGSAQNGTVVTTPLVVTVPAGTPQLVMELFTPNGQSGGYRFFVGSNAASETGPSYFSAPACGISAPITTTALGFPNMHIVFDINGTCNCPSPTPTPCPIISITGTVGQCTTAGPSGIALPGVTITRTSTGGNASTVTDSSGNYLISGLSCLTNTLTPSKAARPPGTNGIDTVDVLAVQRHFLQLGTPLSGCRLSAADCASPVGITTADVIAIQRYFLVLTTGIGNVGQYSFTPPSRSYSPPISNQTEQNYDAVVFGDVATPFVPP